MADFDEGAEVSDKSDSDDDAGQAFYAGAGQQVYYFSTGHLNCGAIAQ